MVISYFVAMNPYAKKICMGTLLEEKLIAEIVKCKYASRNLFQNWYYSCLCDVMVLLQPLLFCYRVYIDS